MADFGVSRALSAGGISSSGLSFGTVMWMAFELIEPVYSDDGTLQKHSKQSDIWALGMVFYVSIIFLTVRRSDRSLRACLGNSNRTSSFRRYRRQCHTYLLCNLPWQATVHPVIIRQRRRSTYLGNLSAMLEEKSFSPPECGLGVEHIIRCHPTRKCGQTNNYVRRRSSNQPR